MTAAGGDGTQRQTGRMAGLAFRLMAMFGVALMPLAFLAYVQMTQYEAEATARSQAALLGETMRAASMQAEQIMRAQGATQAMAALIDPLASDPAACSALLKRFIAESPEKFSFAGFIPLDGVMLCATAGAPHDFSGSPQLAELIRDPRPFVNVNRAAEISRQSVLIFSHPVRSDTGDLIGFVSLSLPHSAITTERQDLDAGPDRAPPVLLTFDASGEVLTSSVGLQEAPLRIPADRELASLVGQEPFAFTTISRAGNRRVFASVPLLSGNLYALGSWPASSVAGSVGNIVLAPIVFPALMWFASLLVAWLAAEHQVIRHIKALRRSITAFAGGDRNLRPLDFSSAPAELRDVGDAYERMTESVLHDEAELEDTIHQKEVLLREVHHRVKNNLQLIASIMNMQMRQAKNPESRELMKGLQDRVMSLATIHRELYQTTGLTDIKADELLGTIVAQVIRMGGNPARPFRVATDLADVRLTPDQAVPLALLLTEALTNALKYGLADPGQQPQLLVRLARTTPIEVELQITNSASDAAGWRADPGDDRTRLGAQLVDAFAAQLGGRVERQHDHGLYRLRCVFPVRPLDEAEARNEPTDQATDQA